MPGSTERDRGYWRDVGTIGSYYAAHMDLVSPLPVFNLYNFDWPIYTSYGPQPPVKITQGEQGQVASTLETVLSPGVVVSGGRVSRSVLSPATYVGAGAEVADSVLMNGVRIGAGAVVRNAILDKNVVVPPGARLGVDAAEDLARGFAVEDGLTILGKDHPFPVSGSAAGFGPNPAPCPAAVRAHWPVRQQAGRAGGGGVRLGQRGDGLVRVEPARVGHHPELGAGQVLRLASRGRPGQPERRAVRRDAGDGDHARRRTTHQRLEVVPARAQLGGGELGGLGAGPADEVGDPEAAGPQPVAIGVVHAGGLVDGVLEDPGEQQRRVEAVAGVREVGLRGRGPQAGVDADEQQPDVRPEQVGHLGAAGRTRARRG